VPFTFLAHQAPVVPLKLLAPRLFCGTALVIGSMAPDLLYFLRGDAAGMTFGHTALGQVAFCLPITAVLTWLVRRVIARPLAARLPDLGPLRLRDYGVLADAPTGLHEWIRVATSALLGSLAHLFLDGITHDGGWAVESFAILRQPVLQGRPLYSVLQYEGSLFFAAITLACLAVVGRRRLLLAWTGSTPTSPIEEGRGLIIAATLLAAAIGAFAGFAGHRCFDEALDHRALCAFLQGTSFAFYALTGACAWLEGALETRPAARPRFA
jgi:hypothetical protein